MDQFNIDKLLRSKLGKPAGGPDDLARGQMEALLRNRNKKRRGFFFLLFALLTGTGVLATWYYGGSSGIDNTKFSEQKNATENNSFSTNRESEKKNEAEEKAALEKTKESNEGTETTNAQEKEEKENTDKAESPKQPHSNKDNKAFITPSSKKDKKSGDVATIAKKGDRPVEKSKESELLNNDTSNNDRAIFLKENEILQPEEKTIEEPENRTRENGSVTTPENNSIDSVLTQNETVSEDSLSIPAVIDTADKSIPQAKFPKGDFHHFWEVQGGALLYSLSANSSQQFSDSRSSFSESITGWSPYFSARRNIGKWQIGLGISRNKFEKNYEDGDTIIVANGDYILIDDEPATFEWYDTTLYNQLRSYNAFTRYKSTNLHFSLGYHILPASSRWDIVPKAGLDINFVEMTSMSYRKTGFYTFVEDSDPLLDYYFIFYTRESKKRMDTFLGVGASVEIRMKFAYHFYAVVEPGFTKTMRDRDKEFKDRFTQYYARFGVGYCF